MSDELTPDQQPDNEVGYGKPPKHTQFKAGHSGNPNGRPNGAKGMKSILRKELSEKVEITENGKKKKLTKQELLIKQLTSKALKGDIQAIRTLSGMVMGVLGAEDEQPAKDAALSRDDQAIMDSWLKRNAGGGDGKGT